MTISEFDEWVGPFCSLYRKCFSGPINENIVKWRYLENPFNDLLMCFAIDEGRLVANYSASPCELMCDGRVVKAALSLNTMTDPEYMGRGLFTALAFKLYGYMEEQGYRLIMGFPNHLSNPTFSAKLDWTIMYEIPSMELKLSEFKRPTVNSDNVCEDDSFTLNHILRENEKNIYLNKSGSYLKWRYHQNIENRYKNFIVKDASNNARSGLVCKEYQEKLNIVDFSFATAGDAELLLHHSIEYARSLKKEKATVWSQLGTSDHLLFEKFGFRNNIPITYFGAKVFSQDKRSADIYDFRNWRIQMGDDNVY